MTTLTPRFSSVLASSSLLLPNSVMLARIGTSTAARNRSKSASPAMASGKIRSAPASAKAFARSIASPMPFTAAASVRAAMTKAGSRRAATAALIRRTAVSRSVTSLPSRCPQRLGLTWSSMCSPATPASSRTATVRAAFIGSPNPVSASTSDGRLVTRAICCARPATSVSVVSPMSGSPRSAEITAPDT
jgi:hypothetical protein